MAKIELVLHSLRHFDELAGKKTMIHGLSPIVNLLTTLAFLITIISFPKYELVAMLPLLLYPVVIISLGDLPVGFFLKKVAFAASFIVFIAIFNLFFDRTPIFQIGSVVVTGGLLSFMSLMLRFCSTVTATLTLISTSGFNQICAALVRLGIPRIFVIQLLLMYRYLSVLLEETARVIQAYLLRSVQGKGIRYDVWGSLLGQLLFRTYDRGQRIYQAMLCRGFDGEIHLAKPCEIKGKDIAYFFGWTLFFVIVRLYNLPHMLGTIFLEGLK